MKTINISFWEDVPSVEFSQENNILSFQIGELYVQATLKQDYDILQKQKMVLDIAMILSTIPVRDKWDFATIHTKHSGSNIVDSGEVVRWRRISVDTLGGIFKFNTSQESEIWPKLISCEFKPQPNIEHGDIYKDHA